MSETFDINPEQSGDISDVSAKFDVDVGRIAAVYAKALLDAAENLGATDAVLEDLDALLTEVLDTNSQFEQLLASEMIKPEEKEGVIDRVLGSVLCATTVHFLKVVARHGRLDCLRAIAATYAALVDERRGVVPVTVTMAATPDRETVDSLRTKLTPIVGGQPKISFETDPDIIGGTVVRVGDTVLDGSVAGQLKRIRKQIIDRSVHEIQSRRDRFRDPAGD